MTQCKVCAMEDYLFFAEKKARFLVRGKPMSQPRETLSTWRFERALHGGDISIIEVDASKPAAAPVIRHGYGRSMHHAAHAVASVLAMMAHRGGEWV